MSNDCIFCQILAGDVPSQEVLSTSTTYAFKDIDPQAPTHVLVIPRQHVQSADTIDSSHGGLLADLYATARAVAAQEGLRPQPNGTGRGYRLVLNVGDDAQNTVPHLHMHLMGGRQMSWPPG